MTLDTIAMAVEAAEKSHFRLVLVVGGPRSGKTAALQDLSGEVECPVVNLNLRLSGLLLDLTQKQRPVRVQRILAKLIEEIGGTPIVLDNIELLFSTELRLDPLRVLQQLARNRTIVAAWPGRIEGDALTYAEPGHSEARRYSDPEASVVLASSLQTSAAHGSSIQTAGEAEE